MKKILLLILLCFTLFSKAQTFEKLFSFTGSNDYANAAFELENGNYLIGVNNKLLCLSSAGDSLWSKTYTFYGDIAKIYRNASNELMLAMTYGKMIFVKINESNGDVLSSFYAPKQFSNSGYTIYDLEFFPDGDYLLSYNNGGGNAATVVRFTPEASNFKWSNDYAGQGFSPKNILIDDTTVVMAGYKDAGTWNKHFYMLKLTSSGTKIWSKEFVRNSTNYDRLVGLQKNTQGNYLAATSMVKNAVMLPAIVVVASNGDSIAVNTINSFQGKDINHGFLYNISVSTTGFYAAGTFNLSEKAPDESNQGVSYMCAFEISDEGKITSTAAYNQLGIFEYYPGSYDGSDAWGNGCIKTSDGNYLLYGVGSKLKDAGTSVWKGYVVKSNLFEANVSSVDKIENTVSIYPNPAHSNVNIVGNNSFVSVSIKLYNSLGQELMLLSNQSGTVLNFSVQDLPKGVYFVSVLNRFNQLIFSEQLLLK